MNKTNIEWCDFTWNPVVGCEHGCSYCYAHKIAMRFTGHFKPTFHPDRLSAPVKTKKPSVIFVCSMADLFGDWVNENWINSVIHTAGDCPQHTFLFLTKNPVRYNEFLFPDNCWVGETITGNTHINGSYPQHKNKFISFEPLMGESPKGLIQGYQWVIIGTMTGMGKKNVIPKYSWIANIIHSADKYKIPVFLKDNLLKLYPELPDRKELPF